MADQVYLGTIFTNNDPDTNGLKSGDVVQLDPTMDNAVIKVAGANSDSVIGVVIVGGSKHSQITVCGFTGQRIRLNIDGGTAVNRGDRLVSDGTVPGNCKVDNAATPNEVFAVAIAAKTAGVGSQVESLYLAPSVSDAISSGASANAYYLVARSTNAPINAINLGALTSGFVKSTVSGGVATITIDTSVGAPETSKYILQQPDGSLPNAQALSALGTGLLKSTTATGVLSTAIINTDYPSVTATYVVASSVGAPPNAVNLGSLTSGVLQQSVATGVATPSVFTAGVNRIAYGSGINGGLTDDPGVIINAGTIQLLNAGIQQLGKQNGALSVGTYDANAIFFFTNGLSRGSFRSTGDFQVFNLASSLVKTDGSGTLQNATAGTDYADPLATYVVTSSSHIPTNGVSLGALTGGTLQQTVAAGVATPSTFSGTLGSIPFYGTSSQLAQNNAKFFWDNTNFRLGIGTTAPTQALDIVGTVAGVLGFRVLNSSASTSAQVQNIVQNDIGSLGYFGISSSIFNAFSPLNSGRVFVGSYSTDLSIFTQTANDIIFSPNATEAARFRSAGNLQMVGVVAPSTPSATQLAVYHDATSHNLAAKNQSGVINHGIQSNVGTTHQFITSIADDGSVTLAQPTYTDLSGSVPAITALTGDVTATGPGTVAATIASHAVTNAKFRQSGAHTLVGNSTSSTADVSDQAILAPLVLTTGNLGLQYDTTTIALSGGTTLVRGALTGDVTAVAGFQSTTLVNIPTAVTAAGYINFTNIAAPATPAAGHTNVYVDSTSLNISAKNASGVVNHGIQSNAGTSHMWVSAIADNGSVTLSQPAYTDISGSVPALTALTGDVVATGPGSAAATIQANVVSNSKFRQSGAGTLVGNATGSLANVSDITPNAPLGFSGGAFILNYDGSSLILSGGTTLIRAALTGDVTAANASNATTISSNAVTYAKFQQVAALSLVGNPTGSLANAQAITLGTNLSFSGTVLNATAGAGGITALTGDVTASGSGSVAATLVNIPTAVTAAGYINFTNIATPTTPAAGHAFVYVDSTSRNLSVKDELGNINHGVRSNTAITSNWIRAIADNGSVTISQPTYSDLASPLIFTSGVTLSTLTVTNDLITGKSGGQTAFGDTASGGALTLSSTANATKGIVWIGTGRSNNSSHFDEVGTTLQVGSTGSIGAGVKIASYAAVAGGVINLATNDAGVSTTAFAASGASLVQAALGTSYFVTRINGLAYTGSSTFDAAQAGLLQLVTTNNAPLNINNIGDAATGGDIVFTSKTTTNELARLGATGGLSLNGSSIATNVSLVTGLVTNANRDRVQFNVGGGALGATTTGDNTFVDIIATNSNIRSGVTAGIYATQRIRALTYTGVSSPNITEAASLYIDGQPFISGATVTNASYALHVASGTTRLDGTVSLPSLTASKLLVLDAFKSVTTRAIQPSASYKWSYTYASSTGFDNNKQVVVVPGDGGAIATGAGVYNAVAGTSVPTTLAAHFATAGGTTVYPAMRAYSTVSFQVLQSFLAMSIANGTNLTYALYSTNGPTGAGSYNLLASWATGPMNIATSNGLGSGVITASVSVAATDVFMLAVFRTDTTSAVLGNLQFTATVDFFE